MILLISVNYKSYDLTKEFIDQLRPYLGKICKLAITDNSSDPNEFLELKKYCKDHLPFISLNETGENLGYFGGAYLSLKKEELDQYEYVIISNNDIEFSSGNIFEELEKYEINDQIACIAPSIILKEHGIDQNPFQSEVTSEFLKLYHKLFYSNYYLAKLRHRLSELKKSTKKVKISNQAVPRNIYAPHGSFIILTKFFFEAGGTVDFPEQLYGEEHFIAKQCHEMGKKVVYDPSISVVHNEHQSTKKEFTKRKFRMLRNAQKYL